MRFHCLLTCAAMVLFAATNTGFAGDADKGPVTPARVEFGGGFVDTVGKVVYSRHKANAVEAFDLRTGKVLWDSDRAFLPLAVDKGRLAALAGGKGGPVIVIFDSKGKIVRESDALPRNAWFGEGPTTHSSARAEVKGNSLIVRWSCSKSPFSGVPAIAMQTTTAHGEAAVELATGKVKIMVDKLILPKPQGLQPPPPPDPNGPKPGLAQSAEPDLKLPPTVAKELEALHEKGCWPRSTKTGKPRPLVFGNQLVLVMYEMAPAGRQLVRKSWDRTTGKPGEAVTLAQGKDLHIINGSGEYLFVEDVGGHPTVEQRPLWILSLKTGKQIAKLTYAQAMSPLCVVGDRLLRQTGGVDRGVLESVDLATGKAVWSRPFYQYHYSGPYPPSAPRK